MLLIGKTRNVVGNNTSANGFNKNINISAIESGTARI